MNFVKGVQNIQIMKANPQPNQTKPNQITSTPF